MIFTRWKLIYFNRCKRANTEGSSSVKMKDTYMKRGSEWKLSVLSVFYYCCCQKQTFITGYMNSESLLFGLNIQQILTSSQPSLVCLERWVIIDRVCVCLMSDCLAGGWMGGGVVRTCSHPENPWDKTTFRSAVKASRCLDTTVCSNQLIVCAGFERKLD